MIEPFLILHKVRGEPAFDIAERWTFDGEEGWIISTSGHRAYPAKTWALTELEGNVGQGYWAYWLREWGFPDSLPDHYAANDRPIREATYNVSARAAGLLAKLGLVSKVERRD